MAVETWESIADWYADHVRGGSAMHAFGRDMVLNVLPDVMSDVRVLDVGCGEGIITRAVADRGAVVLGIDPVERLVEYARAAEDASPVGADYAVDDGCTLSIVADASVEWVTAGLVLNNVPDLAAAIASAARVLVPGGGLVFTVPHPCFEAPDAAWMHDADAAVRRVIGDYLTEGFWRSGNPKGVRRAGNQHRTVSTYLMALIDNGFVIESVAEPAPDGPIVAQQPQRAGLPPFLMVTARRIPA